MTYSETFYLLTLALLACIPLALLLKTPGHASAPSAGH
jgi:DHA2 family multidrug resistance protein